MCMQARDEHDEHDESHLRGLKAPTSWGGLAPNPPPSLRSGLGLRDQGGGPAHPDVIHWYGHPVP
jgi:hypothetical protein